MRMNHVICSKSKIENISLTVVSYRNEGFIEMRAAYFVSFLPPKREDGDKLVTLYLITTRFFSKLSFL